MAFDESCLKTFNKYCKVLENHISSSYELYASLHIVQVTTMLLAALLLTDLLCDSLQLKL